MARVALWPLLKTAFKDWSEDQAPRLAAALAYYTVFSLAPVLVIVVAVAGLAFGAEAVRSGIVEQVRGMLGDGGADLVLAMLEGGGEAEGKRGRGRHRVRHAGARRVRAVRRSSRTRSTPSGRWSRRPGRGVWA